MARIRVLPRLVDLIPMLGIQLADRIRWIIVQLMDATGTGSTSTRTL